MGKTKTIYTAKGIFTKLLEDAEKEYFLIPTYQRGYKWTSQEDDSQVITLLKDLYYAHKNSREERYYLQFITLKDGEDFFEVIDGQQRLTTLTILFSSFFSKLGFKDNFVIKKLNYQIRKNFLEEFVYSDDGIKNIISHKTWDEFIEQNVNHNNQDVFYLFYAINAINVFLNDAVESDDLLNFFNYVSDKVHIIVNKIDGKMSGEKIFINVNKGVKLKDEDLVKGLLITKIPLDNNNHRLTENEINETRTLLGKQWDEISHWANRKDIFAFYKQTNGIAWIIKLAFPSIDDGKSDIPIFTFLFEKCKEGEKATKLFERIYSVKLILDDWFNISQIHNLLGFLLHSKHSNSEYDIHSVWKKLNYKNPKSEIVNGLKDLVIKEIPFDKEAKTIGEINYNEPKSKNKLFNIFLVLDVMKYLPIQKEDVGSYNFSRISSERWSIEHIFPQNPEDLKNISEFKTEEEIKILKELLPPAIDESEISSLDGDEKNNILNLFSKIKDATTNLSINQKEKTALIYLLSNNANDLHRIGNLALLESGMNSSLSNNYFDEKRKILVKKIGQGQFVPNHTYDVFSKLIIEKETDLHVWSKQDIEDHEKYIDKQIDTLVTYLKAKN